MKLQNACPICCKALKADEKLTAQYVADKDWWMIEHVRFSPRGEPDHSICQQAGFQFDHRIDLTGKGLVMEGVGA